MTRCVHRFEHCISQIGDDCLLYQTLEKTVNSSEHVRQLLAKFSPATLERYLACIAAFLEFWTAETQLNNRAIEAWFTADCMLAQQRSATQDRAVHRTSPLAGEAV